MTQEGFDLAMYVLGVLAGMFAFVLGPLAVGLWLSRRSDGRFERKDEE